MKDLNERQKKALTSSEKVKIMASIVHRNDCLLVVHYERDKIAGKNKQK